MNADYLVVNDAIAFCNMLGANYGIAMQQVPKQGCYAYLGEYYTIKGTPLRVSIQVYPLKTDVRVFTMRQECIYQKSYSTLTDKKSLSSSVGLVNFIEKSIKTR